MMINRLHDEIIDDIAASIVVENATFLITGATGLIGRCIIEVLSEINIKYNRKYKILAIGRNADLLNAFFCNFNEVECIVHDITNPIELNCDVDYVIHAASYADPVSYSTYPVETILTNILGAKNILEFCKEKYSRVLLTSTFEIYGKLDTDEYCETDYGIIDLDVIRSCYPESKRSSELLFRAYADEYSVNCVIVRLPSVYGPTMKMNDSKAHAQFIKNALSGHDIVLKSDGLQKRSYLYVKDAVSGIFSVLFHGESQEVYNISNENSIASIYEVANTVADLCGMKVVYDLPDEVEKKGFSKPQNCVLFNKKIRELGWEGKYTLNDGLKETISMLSRLFEL